MRRQEAAVPPVTDTIAALATPVGRGALGVVRVSGPDVKRVGRRLSGELPAPRVASCRTIYGPDGQPIDEAIVLYFAGPKSFTGEDILEIQTHGGNVVTGEVLRAVFAAGARPAAAGEFTERAFLNGKIDLIQAEAIADLIESASTRAARLAHQSLTGRFSSEVASIGRELEAIRVQLEATIDFPDEAMPESAIEQWRQSAISVRERLAELQQRAARGAKLNQGLDIAIVGRPNVGKSTLLNALAQEDRAIVTNEPGTTRDVLSVTIDVEGLSVRLHDTAGLHEAENAIDREGMRRALQTVDRSDAVFHLILGESEQRDVLVDGLSIPVFTIRNKIDLAHLSPSIERRSNGVYAQISAKHEQGLDLLLSALQDCFETAGDGDSAFLARERHFVALRCAAEALDFDHGTLYSDAPELAAEHLRRAGHALGTLTGEYTNEALLGDIFSTFCIGK